MRLIRSCLPVGVAVAAAFVGLFVQGCSSSQTSCAMHVTYYASYERAYDSIDISGSKLTFVYYKAPDTATCSLTHPCFGDTNLKAFTAELTGHEVSALSSALGDLHLDKLPDTAGDLTSADYKPVLLSVRNAKYEKTIVYRSTSWASPPPIEFKQAAALLADLVFRKFQHRIDIPKQ